MKKNILKVMLLVLAAALCLTACQTATQNQASQSVAPAAQPRDVQGVAVDGSSEEDDLEKIGKLKIGFAQMGYNSTWRINETDDIMYYLNEAGHEVIFTDANQDTQKQVNDVEDILAQGVDYMIIAPREQEGLVPALDACKAAGVPVILVDRRANGTPGVDYATCIMSDPVWHGYAMGEWINEHFEGKDVNIVELYGVPGSTSAIDRAQGLRDAMEEWPNLKLLESIPNASFLNEAITATENLLQTYGDEVDVIVTQSSNAIQGAVQGVKNMGLTPGEDVLIVGVDGTKADLQSILAGDVACAVQCNPYLGSLVIDAIHSLALGKEIESHIVVVDQVFDSTNAQEWVFKV